MSWYGKRAALATVYTTTELYMLTDKSHEFNHTWDFLQRRIDDAVNASYVPQQVEITRHDYAHLHPHPHV